MPILNVSPYKSTSEIKVFVSKIKADADLCVNLVDNQSETIGHALWLYTDTKAISGKSIIFVNNKSDADIKVYFTGNKSEIR